MGEQSETLTKSSMRIHPQRLPYNIINRNLEKILLNNARKKHGRELQRQKRKEVCSEALAEFIFFLYVAVVSYLG